MSARLDFWKDIVSEAFEEAGMELPTDDQLASIAGSVESAANYMDMAFPSGPPDPAVGHRAEIDRLKAQIRAEQDKVQCKVCGGTGREVLYGPSHCYVSDCWKCHGKGRHAP